MEGKQVRLALRFEGPPPEPERPNTCPSCGQVYYGPINQTHEILCPLIERGDLDEWTRPKNPKPQTEN